MSREKKAEFNSKLADEAILGILQQLIKYYASTIDDIDILKSEEIDTFKANEKKWDLYFLIEPILVDLKVIKPGEYAPDSNVNRELSLTKFDNFLFTNNKKIGELIKDQLKTMSLPEKKTALTNFANEYVNNHAEVRLRRHRDDHLPGFLKAIARWLDRMGLTHVTGNRVTDTIGNFFEKTAIKPNLARDKDRELKLADFILPNELKKTEIKTRDKDRHSKLANFISATEQKMTDIKIFTHNGFDDNLEIRTNNETDRKIVENLLKKKNIPFDLTKEKHFSIIDRDFDKLLALSVSPATRKRR
jgi:hypothetical protein